VSAGDLPRPDPVAETSPILAGISSASIQGRIAFGPRAGARVWRVGEEPDAPWVLSSSPRHAHIAGFDLHANVAVPAADRARLEQLCRYLLRPPVAQDRLRRMGDDRILLTLKTPWADGTRHLMFAPMELLEKLAALTPRPRINLILYHGVLAPHARWRARVVAYGALPGIAATAPNPVGDSDDDAVSPAPPRHWAWANLMRRAGGASEHDLHDAADPRARCAAAAAPGRRAPRTRRQVRLDGVAPRVRGKAEAELQGLGRS
jgi:hypothetical protein